MSFRSSLSCFGLFFLVTHYVAFPTQAGNLTQPSIPKLTEISVKSTLDETMQPSMFWAPAVAEKKPLPLFVYLHSWSGDYKQNHDTWLKEAASREWIYLHPNFRGRNDDPQACGSKFARQDILDAIAWVIQKYKVDESRIYLAGASGGGHMSMLMAGYYPERFSAVSAWVGISNLRSWYNFHAKDGVEGKYAKMMSQCCGGAPGDGKIISSHYYVRSPINVIHRVGDLPIEFCVGITDGYTGSVPITHSINAFNEVARTNGHDPVSKEEIERLDKLGKTKNPPTENVRIDPTYNRAIFHRQQAGPARITVFDGGHEAIAAAGVTWLEKQTRKTRSPNEDQ